MNEKTVIFGVRDREYDAKCENVQSQGLEPAKAPPEERCNLKIVLHDVSPFDLKNSSLLHAAFIEHTNGVQTTIEGVTDEEALYNCRFEPMQLLDGSRGDEDCRHKIEVRPRSGELSKNLPNPTTFRPRSGIVLRKIKPSENPVPNKPSVSLELSVKGLSYDTQGDGWRYSAFGVRFFSKTTEELDEEQKAKQKAKAEKEEKKAKKAVSPGQAALPMETPAGPEDEVGPGGGDPEDMTEEEELVEGELPDVAFQTVPEIRETELTFEQVGKARLLAAPFGAEIIAGEIVYTRKDGKTVPFEMAGGGRFSVAHLVTLHANEVCKLVVDGEAKAWE